MKISKFKDSFEKTKPKSISINLSTLNSETGSNLSTISGI